MTSGVPLRFLLLNVKRSGKGLVPHSQRLCFLCKRGGWVCSDKKGSICIGWNIFRSLSQFRVKGATGLTSAVAVLSAVPESGGED